jgi:hypothetical protein
MALPKRQYKNIHTLTSLDRLYERILPISKSLQESIDGYDWRSLPYHASSGNYHFRVDDGNTLVCALCDNDIWNEAITPPFVYELTTIVKNEFLKIDPTAKFNATVNLNINLTSTDPKFQMRQMDVHSDSDEFNNYWSFLVHLVGNSGSTMMYNNMVFGHPVKEFEFVPGKLCIYPSVYAHAGILPNTAEDRVIARYIMEIDTVLNDKVKEGLK